MTTPEEQKAIKSFIEDCMSYMDVTTCAACKESDRACDECDIEDITTIEQAKKYCLDCDGSDCYFCELCKHTSPRRWFSAQLEDLVRINPDGALPSYNDIERTIEIESQGKG